MKLGGARAASPDLPHVGLRDLAEEDRLRLGRTVHHDEPRTPNWGRDIATSRDEPRVGSGDFAGEAADTCEWRCPDDGHRRMWRIPRRCGSGAPRRPTKPNLGTEHAAPLIVGAEAKADATECAGCCDFEVWPKSKAA